MKIDDLLPEVVPMLQERLGPEFRYVKSRREFRRKDEGGFSYVRIDCRGGGGVTLSFRMGVRIDRAWLGSA